MKQHSFATTAPTISASTGRLLTSLLGIILCAAAAWAVHRVFHEHSLNDIMVEFQTRSPVQLVFAFLTMISSYIVLTGYDLLGLHYIHKQVPKPRAMLTSFLGYSFANNLGFLGGAGLRLRRYLVLGLSPLDVGKLVAFSAITFWIGFSFLGGLLFLLSPPPPPKGWLTHDVLQMIGIGLMAVVIVYLLQSHRTFRDLEFRGRTFVLPDLPTRIAQIAISSCDWLLASATLYFVLPSDFHVAFPVFAATFLCAQMLGLASNVPGGVGVFESILVYMLPIPEAAEKGVLASLILYRAIYFITPLIVATILTGVIEIRHNVLAARGRIGSEGESPEPSRHI